MRLLMALAAVLVLGQSAYAGQRCYAFWVWNAEGKLAAAEQQLRADEAAILSDKALADDILEMASVILQADAGTREPADVANQHVLLVLEMHKAAGAEVAAMMKASLEEAYQRYLNEYNRLTWQCAF